MGGFINCLKTTPAPAGPLTYGVAFFGATTIPNWLISLAKYSPPGSRPQDLNGRCARAVGINTAPIDLAIHPVAAAGFAQKHVTTAFWAARLVYIRRLHALLLGQNGQAAFKKHFWRHRGRELSAMKAQGSWDSTE